MAPDTAEDTAHQQTDSRSVHASPTLGGMVRLDGWLEPIGATVICAELHRLEQQLFEQDWAYIRGLYGDKATADMLPRTAAQRRADALKLMAQRSAATPPGAKAPEPVVNIIVDQGTFEAEMRRHHGDPDAAYPTNGTCELDDETVITPAQAYGQALIGHVRRVVFGADGCVINLGRKQRLFTGAAREALILRDRVCDVPGCEIPARYCEADHITEWQHGGHTDQCNGKMKCGHHHRLKTKRDRPPGRTDE